jgi:hypothetical protein
MKSRFKQSAKPTTLDFGLGRHSFVEQLNRQHKERIMALFLPVSHAIGGCTPDNPCGGPGCINTERAKQRPAAN